MKLQNNNVIVKYTKKIYIFLQNFNFLFLENQIFSFTYPLPYEKDN